MAVRKGMGFLDNPKEAAPDPNAAKAREAIRKVRGGEGAGRSAETITDEEGRARDAADVEPRPSKGKPQAN